MANRKPELVAYQNKWDKENNKQYKMKLSLKNDADLIEFLDSLTNKQGYIKDLIRADIKKRKGDK